MSKSDVEKLRDAIDKAKQGENAGNDPFGAAIFIGDQLIAVEHNRVLSVGDPVPFPLSVDTF